MFCKHRELRNEQDAHAVSRLEIERLSNEVIKLGEELQSIEEEKRKACTVG